MRFEIAAFLTPEPSSQPLGYCLVGLLATLVDCVTGLPIADWPSPVIFQEIKNSLQRGLFPPRTVGIWRKGC